MEHNKHIIMIDCRIKSSGIVFSINEGDIK